MAADCKHIHKVQPFSAQEVQARIVAAQQHCRTRGVRFTPLRQQIYALILSAAAPVGAYDLITLLQQARLDDESETPAPASKNVAPPTVYRSLEFLLSEGLIHQLTSINAYVPCCHPRAQHTAAFLICDACHSVQECSSMPAKEIIHFAEADAGFVVARSVIELSGRCQACQNHLSKSDG
ncbi:transcriptional repressor [Psychrobacter aestuarii]|uniref:Transcriptional repressor n=1 Tax=Psychrobacter aestuarii TaxID=556327 RepID=A0ABP3FSN4_9GAMM